MQTKPKQNRGFRNIAGFSFSVFRLVFVFGPFFLRKPIIERVAVKSEDFRYSGKTCWPVSSLMMMAATGQARAALSRGFGIFLIGGREDGRLSRFHRAQKSS